jgi:hypothetical protein
MAFSLTFMEDIDLAKWGLIVVPIGVAICFGPALLVWFFAELKAEPEGKKPDTKQ